jgi:hypothetical protein
MIRDAGLPQKDYRFGEGENEPSGEGKGLFVALSGWEKKGCGAGENSRVA